ncbi:MAG: HD domain-containing phosphohydrolase [Bacilli bacterium]
MIRDFSKDEYDEFKSLFSISDTWQIIKNIFMEIDRKVLEHGERVAYIALTLAKKQKLDTTTTRNLVFAALFHDIGMVWSDESEGSEFKSFNPKNTYDHALSSYLFLKYFSPLKKYSEIVLFHHGRADREQINKYYKLGVKLHICDRIDVVEMNSVPRERTIELLRSNSGTMFYENDVNDMISLIKETTFLDNLKTDKCRETIDKYLAGMYFRRDVVRNYLFMATYCFEFFDTETMFHARMTASLCYLLGRYMNLDLHQLSIIYTAGLFGDMGKARIDHSILKKPGKLTKEEQMIMRKHDEYTKEILEGCIKDPQVIDIAYSHHERLDGSGYPRGLKGDELDINKRIIAVADIASALMAHRSYKDAYPMEKTIEELENMVKDGKLDGNVVAAFITHQQEISSYLENHINRVLRTLQAMRGEKARIKFANTWSL